MVEIQERIFREVGIGDHDAAEVPAAPADDVSLNGDEAPITVD